MHVDGVTRGECRLGATRPGLRARLEGSVRRGLDWRHQDAGTRSATRCTQCRIQNYLGYAYYRLRQLDAAFEHYRRALTLNPRQRSAHEHLGEAYLVVNNLAKAQEHLAALERICLLPCEQYDGLRKAIDKYSSRERQGLTDPAL
jgi:tetratricopeptide (TPR) repeat protein